MEEVNEEYLNEKPKRGKTTIIILVLSLAVAGDIAWRAVDHFRAPNTAANKGSAAASTKKIEKSASKTSSKAKVTSVVSLDPFLVNLADREDVRFVKATFHLGLAERGGELDNNPAVLASIRDTIISLLSSKTADEILTAPGKDKLREEIRRRVNAVILKEKIQEVYIVDFVVQL